MSQNENKFLTGDVIIGNELADEYYSVTREGTKWYVVGYYGEVHTTIIHPNYTDYLVVKSYNPDGSIDEQEWYVEAKAFDLYRRDVKNNQDAISFLKKL